MDSRAKLDETTRLIPEDEYVEIDLEPHDDNTDIPSKFTAIAQIVSTPWSLRSYLSTVWPFMKAGMLYTTSLLTAVPVSVYAFGFPLGVRPELLSWELWQSVPVHLKAAAIVFALINLGLGTMVRIEHIPEAIKRITEIFLSYCDDLPAFVRNNFILIMAGVAGVSTLALGYYAFAWAGETLAIISALMSMAITFSFRIDFMSILLDDIRKVFDADSKFQSELISQLKQIRAEHIARFDEALKSAVDSGGQINEDVIRQCLLKMYDAAYSEEVIDSNGQSAGMQLLLDAPTCVNQIKNYISRISNLGLGLAIGGTYFIFFAQTGYDGTKMICQMMANQCAIDDLPYSAKLSLALFTGASSGVLGFISGTKFLNTLEVTYAYMKEGYGNAIKVIGVVVGSSLSATSLAASAKAMAERPNLFGITTGSLLGFSLIGGNWLLATSFDINAIMSNLTKNEVNSHKAIHWLENNRLSMESVNALKNHSIFKHQQPISGIRQIDDVIELDNMVPGFS